MNWLLPEHFSDVLPPEAERIEALRREILDLFRLRGFERVMPPMLEYLESLLTGAGQDLDLRTFKLSDQLSGRTLGLRADMTPQVARIDAHLLNHPGVTRLCYCGSILHTRPASLAASREPIQIGAEIYGHAGLAADIEILRLMGVVLAAAGFPAFRVDLGHVGLFRALSQAAGMDAPTEERLFSLLEGKDVPALECLCATLPAPYGTAILKLPDLYGDADVLARAADELPALPEIEGALAQLAALARAVPEIAFSIDLADLRGYHYHNGVVFAAYVPGHPSAIALGGRYDGVGKCFGRARPATGFSLDLRELARRAPGVVLPEAILAPPAPHDAALTQKIAALRQAGEIVVERLPEEDVATLRYTRFLAPEGEGWRITGRKPER
ncbi:MAG: ATP phosphoribosyltransferase regulatory subunit [Zoogloeaceae bacterium]|jgi:ATP phosphoribosyltransferase regulatory subunit|nr:ATP phosphoribosyltransferase regulatory subunit [Zoogloeaceae bacterium]